MKFSNANANQGKSDKLFFKAIEAGDLEAVKYLLNEASPRANINYKNDPRAEYLEYCLVYATKHNKLDILKYFLEETELKKHLEIDDTIKPKESLAIRSIYREIHQEAGKNGNLDLVKYVTKNLKSNNFDIFKSAAKANHAHILDCLVKENLLNQTDRETLSKNHTDIIKHTYRSYATEAVNYLQVYFKEEIENSNANSAEFKADIMRSMLEVGSKKAGNLSLLMSLLNDPEIQKNQNQLIDKRIFPIIAGKQNLELYSLFLISLNSEYVLERAVGESIKETLTTEKDLLSENPLFMHLLNNYEDYVKKYMEKILTNTVLNRNTNTRFEDLRNYPSLFKEVSKYKYKLLESGVQSLELLKGIELLTSIVNAEYDEPVDIHFSDNIYFKNLAWQEKPGKFFTTEKVIPVLAMTIEKFPNLDIESILPIFEKRETEMFLNKALLRNKLTQDLPSQNKAMKSEKI